MFFRGKRRLTKRQIGLLGLLGLLSAAQLTYSFKLTRVILATDANPMYLEFWPVAAKAWAHVTGLRPTLALIADESVKIDTTLGDVVRFEPLPSIPTSLQAQVIRLLLPALYPDDGCLISDIDMIPLQRDYFIKNALPYPKDSFIIYRDLAYGGGDERYPMCYVAGLGRVFAEVFRIEQLHNMANIATKLKELAALNLGWDTDELVLGRATKRWAKSQPMRLVKLHQGVGPRIDRSNWRYDLRVLRSGRYYLDAHLLRPYSSYKQKIDELVQFLGIRF